LNSPFIRIKQNSKKEEKKAPKDPQNPLEAIILDPSGKLIS
jgi:hypothetical protein